MDQANGNVGPSLDDQGSCGTILVTLYNKVQGTHSWIIPRSSQWSSLITQWSINGIHGDLASYKRVVLHLDVSRPPHIWLHTLRWPTPQDTEGRRERLNCGKRRRGLEGRRLMADVLQGNMWMLYVCFLFMKTVWQSFCISFVYMWLDMVCIERYINRFSRMPAISWGHIRIVGTPLFWTTLQISEVKWDDVIIAPCLYFLVSHCGLGGAFVILLMEEILHQLMGSFSHYLQGFKDPRWCRNSMSSLHAENWLVKNQCQKTIGGTTTRRPLAFN